MSANIVLYSGPPGGNPSLLGLLNAFSLSQEVWETDLTLEPPRLAGLGGARYLTSASLCHLICKTELSASVTGQSENSQADAGQRACNLLPSSSPLPSGSLLSLPASALNPHKWHLSLA